MNMKKLTVVACAVAMAASISACDKNSSTETVTETTVTTAALSPEEQIHYDMVQRSFVQFGNTHRIEKKLAEAAGGEETTVAYIGGSITEGIGGGAEGCYAKLSCNYIAENYGTGDNVKYVNAGISGTPSILGNLRVDRDVLAENADIVFIEFAVNDGSENIYKESFESLVRTILMHENEPAVILLFMVTENGHTCQEHMKQIGEYYELPMISVPDAIQPEFEAGRMVWDDYSDDGSHPNESGHMLVAEFISNWFEQLKMRDAVEAEYQVKPIGKFGNAYDNAFMAEADYDNSNENLTIGDTGSFTLDGRGIAGFAKGAWIYNGEGTDPLKMSITGNSFFLVCKRHNNTSMGKFEVYINGKRIATIDTNQKDGWGDPWAFQVIKWQSVKDMEVEIVPTADSAGKEIEIYAIACTQNSEFEF
ncbi:MAG: SGNH/GDSL hydrolase family protein [Oscillospiraceae bacterium]|nr:SGNH/GDSL hydrolase family protein [Oscillospiraceae bacterium]